MLFVIRPPSNLSEKSMLRKSILLSSVLIAVACLGIRKDMSAEVPSAKASEEASASAPRVFEMRTYIAHPDRLEALHKRFREHTNRLFEKHGMELIGYWTPTDGDASKNTLVYILAYPSREARDASWKAFLDDPDWKKAYAASHEDGPIVAKVESVFLAPTDYSAIR
jgi:hypothetical protein